MIWIHVPKPLNEIEYASEKEFYFSFFLTSIGKSNKENCTNQSNNSSPPPSTHTDNVLLVLLFQLWTNVANRAAPRLTTVHLVKAITLAKVAKFFMIPIVIWSRNEMESASLRLVLVNGYYFLSLVHVLSVLTECSRKTSAVKTLLTVMVKHIVMTELTHRLRNLVMIW